MSLSSVSHADRAKSSEPVAMTSASFPISKLYLLLSLVLAIFAVAPLFYPGYIQTHNGFTALWNVADLRVNRGDWRWLPHLAGYFEPWRSDGLWLYYLAGLLPFEPAVAIKIGLGLSWLLGSLGMFWWLKNWLGQPAAVIAALVYTYLPYQIATVYVRGALGELFLGGLLPWAILAAETASCRAGESNSRSSLLYVFLTGLVWCVLGLSHLGLTLWTFVFATLLLLLTHRRQATSAILSSFSGVILAVGVTLSIVAASPYAAPATASWPAQFFDHFLYPFQLFSAYWGFGPSRPGWNDGMSFQLGLAAMGLTILTAMLWQRKPSPAPISRAINHRLIFFAGAALVFILLQFALAEPIWRLPLFPGQTLASTLSYPWQLTRLAGLCLAVWAGACLRLDEQLTRLPWFASIIILVILSSYSYLSPQFIQIKPELINSPPVILGANQLVLLAHDFTVDISGNTAGLERGPTSIPLAAHGPLQAAETLRLHVTWQPLQAFSEDWKVFVHLVDAQGRVLAQFDGQPLAGAYPTSQWIPGEQIEDSYPLPFPPEAPPGPYRVFVGLYHETTGARLPVPLDSEGRVVLKVE